MQTELFISFPLPVSNAANDNFKIVSNQKNYFGNDNNFFVLTIIISFFYMTLLIKKGLYLKANFHQK
jgi:hypothetical protein